MPSLTGTTLVRQLPRKNVGKSLTADALQEIRDSVSAADVARAIREALDATYTSAAGNTFPDHRTRLEAGKVWMNYMVGMPLQRQEVIATVSEPPEAIIKRMLQSPAARSKLVELLNETEAGKKFIAENGATVPLLTAKRGKVRQVAENDGEIDSQAEGGDE